MLVLKKYYIFLLLTLSFCACREQQNIGPLKAESDYEKAESFLNQRNDSAFYYFNKISINSTDSVLIAQAYNSMAVIQSDAGDYFGSQQNLLFSLSFLNELKIENRKCLSSDYNELGNTSLNLKNYDAAINYYDLALRFAPNKNFETITLNNKAVVYQKEKRYTEAITIYKKIINESKKNTKEYARILSNLAKVKWLKDSTFNATADLLTALAIRKDEKDEWGLNASYSHLSDYYRNSHPDSALIYATKMYETTRSLDSPDDELEALQKLIMLSPVKDLKQYFIRYQYLSDSIQTSRNAAKNQFALIRYDAEKNKTDNLRLQKVNAEKETQNIILFATLIVLFVLAYLIVKEARNKMRKNQLKLSKKVHDVVANGIYRIMKETEHSDYINKDPLLDKLEVLYEKSRDISYEHPAVSNIDFSKEIKDLLISFSGSDVRVNIIGNEQELWDGVTGNIKNELKHVLQELMVNMGKHSSARNVVVKFDLQNNKLHIQYTDDGIGLQSGFNRGNGLTNTGNRINDIGGEFIFDPRMTKGLKIHIYIPIT